MSRPSSSSPASNSPRVVSPRSTRVAFAEIVGEQALRGRPLSAGALLETIDGFAATVAENVINNPTVMAGAERLDVKRRVFHGDLVRFEGQLLYTGRSSATVQVTAYRRSFRDSSFEHLLDCYMTLVAVDEDGRPAASGIPKLADPKDPELAERMERWAQERKSLNARWAKSLAALDALPHVSKAMLDVTNFSGDGASIEVEDAEVEFATVFVPKHLNGYGSVYGGELLHWMDKTAVFCVQSFTQNENVVTVGLSRFGFLLPLKMDDIVTLSARITRVSGARLEVEVNVFRKKLRGVKSEKSHIGFFTVANLNADNEETAVKQRPKVREEDQDGMRAMLKAQHRASLADEEAALYAFPPLDVWKGVNNIPSASKL